jgi:hypothetical protein
MIMPTTITGSYPRPLWFDRNLAGQSFKSALGDSLFRDISTRSPASSPTRRRPGSTS